MMEFLSEYGGTILVSVIVLAVVTAVVIKLLKDKKAGKSSCGCGCGNCPASKMCHKNKN